MIAENKITHPISSGRVIISCRKSAPVMRANTDSRLIMSEAEAGSVRF